MVSKTNSMESEISKLRVEVAQNMSLRQETEKKLNLALTKSANLKK